jgi:hypothetical protein
MSLTLGVFIHIYAVYDNGENQEDFLFKILENVNSGSTNDTFAKLIFAIFGLTAAITALGFIFSSITKFVTWLIQKVFYKSNYMQFESPTKKMSHKAREGLKRIKYLDKENIKESPDNFVRLIILFDHAYLPDGILDWMVRRWNYQIVAWNSAIAVSFATVCGVILHFSKLDFLLNVHLLAYWTIFLNLPLVLVFVFVGKLSRQQVVDMNIFLAENLDHAKYEEFKSGGK